MIERRKDNKGRVLKENETQRKDGSYDYRWRTSDQKRHSIYAKTLEELREKEELIKKDISDGIKSNAKRITVNDIYDVWVTLKKGLKDNTFQGYKYSYEHFVRQSLGTRKILDLKRSDIRRFYISPVDNKNLKYNTIDSIHTVLHQVLDLAVEDGYLRNNISDNALKELKQAENLYTEKRRALTIQEQNLFINFLKNSNMYHRWYPIFCVMLGTGLRIGEVTGLRLEDIDFKENTISVNHTLVYFQHGNKKVTFDVNSPKTKAGIRTIPMIESVRKALLDELEYQKQVGIKCIARFGEYTNFIFVNRFGNVQHQGTLNKALKRIIRDCNQAIMDGKIKSDIYLPPFSCHHLRHTFTTRLCESGMNVKVIQSVLGHSDVSTTLDIYADVTKDLKKAEIISFEDFIKKKKIALY